MTHLHEETLAGRALGEPESLGLRERWHLGRCAECSGRLSELRRVLAAARAAAAAGPRPVRPPRPGLLAAIHAELDLDAGPLPADPRPQVPASGRADGHAARRPRRTRWLVAAAALAVVGVVAAVAHRQESPQVLATAVLAPLPAKTGSGTAEVVRSRDGEVLSVSITASSPPGTFEELWLLDAGTGGMISVGIVPPTGRATFPLPSSPALAAYTVVDVSLEPFDGNPAHSRNSILRGTLG